MHAFLNRSSLAALGAITLGLALPVTAANAHDRAQQRADAGSQVAQSQADTRASPDAAKDDTAGAAKSPTTGSDRQAQKQMKHPPTAAMDAATPTEKSTSGKSASEKHPPTSAMDNAAPDEKSPGSRQ